MRHTKFVTEDIVETFDVVIGSPWDTINRQNVWSNNLYPIPLNSQLITYYNIVL